MVEGIQKCQSVLKCLKKKKKENIRRLETAGIQTLSGDIDERGRDTRRKPIRNQQSLLGRDREGKKKKPHP